MERKELFREQKTRQPFPIMIDGARAGLQVKCMLSGRGASAARSKYNVNIILRLSILMNIP